MPAANVKLRGSRKLDRALARLPQKVGRRVMRGAVSAGVEPIREQAERNALTIGRTGALSASMEKGRGSRVRTYKHSDGRVVAVGIIGPAKGYSERDPQFGNVIPNLYAHLVEFGTQAHRIGGKLNIGPAWISGGVQHPGGVARPFLRNALSRRKRQAFSTMRVKAKQLLSRIR